MGRVHEGVRWAFFWWGAVARLAGPAQSSSLGRFIAPRRVALLHTQRESCSDEAIGPFTHPLSSS